MESLYGMRKKAMKALRRTRANYKINCKNISNANLKIILLIFNRLTKIKNMCLLKIKSQ